MSIINYSDGDITYFGGKEYITDVPSFDLPSIVFNNDEIVSMETSRNKKGGAQTEEYVKQNWDMFRDLGFDIKQIAPVDVSNQIDGRPKKMTGGHVHPFELGIQNNEIFNGHKRIDTTDHINQAPKHKAAYEAAHEDPFNELLIMHNSVKSGAAEFIEDDNDNDFIDGGYEYDSIDNVGEGYISGGDEFIDDFIKTQVSGGFDEVVPGSDQQSDEVIGSMDVYRAGNDADEDYNFYSDEHSPIIDGAHDFYSSYSESPQSDSESYDFYE